MGYICFWYTTVPDFSSGVKEYALRNECVVENKMADLAYVIIVCIPIIDDFINPPNQNQTDDTDIFTTIAACYCIRENRPKVMGYLEEVVHDYTEEQFWKKFRMSREAFVELEQVVVPLLPKRLYQGGRPATNNSKKILAGICYLATTEALESIAETFGVCESTLFTSVKDVMQALNRLKHVYIKLPNYKNGEVDNVMRRFQVISGLRGVVGAINGTHIRIKPPSTDAYQYVNRKKFHSLVLQAICDDKCMFTDGYCGWPDSVHDARVWRNSDIYASITSTPGMYLPNASFLLGDPAYPLSHFLFTLNRNNGRLTPAKVTFNRKLSGTRVVVERAFALLKGRWRRLKYVEKFNTSDISELIIACCVLHNHCLKFDNQHDNILDNEEEDDDPNVCLVLPDTPIGIDKRDGLLARIKKPKIMHWPAGCS